jgi:hypothetical protein
MMTAVRVLAMAFPSAHLSVTRWHSVLHKNLQCFTVYVSESSIMLISTQVNQLSRIGGTDLRDNVNNVLHRFTLILIMDVISLLSCNLM